MKIKILLYLILTMNLFYLKAQRIYDPIIYFKTQTGFTLEIDSYKNNDNKYVVSITERYSDIITGKYKSMTVYIFESKIIEFEKEIDEVYNYLIKWHNTAIENKISYLNKDLPFKSNSLVNPFCTDNIYTPSNKNVKYNFNFINNYSNINIQIKDNDTYNSCSTYWPLTKDDIINFKNEVKRMIELQKEYDRKSKEVDNLFK